jgi:TPR repeat protein
MRTVLIAALLCAASMLLSCAHAQQDDAARWQFTEELKARAEKGDPEAQSNLGACYGNGAAVAKDHVEAVKWYRRAVEQDYAPAQNNLGSCYLNGNGVTKDVAEALRRMRWRLTSGSSWRRRKVTTRQRSRRQRGRC